jgi:glycosyltransferase involved in cell wall biosynthesis
VITRCDRSASDPDLEMRFSIIIPTFNRVDLLRQTLESLQPVVRRIHEILVVDDGSSDGTVAFLAREHPGVRLLRQTNSGPGSARNRGIEAATGDWVAFLDSDDLWFPWTLHHLETAVAATGAELLFLKPFRFSDPSEVMTLIDQSGDREPRWERFEDYFSSGDVWRWWGASSFAIRRAAIGTARFSEDRINGEDSDWLMKLGDGHRVAQMTGAPTFGYREHGASLMSDWKKTLDGAMNLVTNELAGVYPGGEGRRKERRRILGRHLRPVILEALARGERDHALQLMRPTWCWMLEERRFRFLAAFLFRLLTTRK